MFNKQYCIYSPIDLCWGHTDTFAACVLEVCIVSSEVEYEISAQEESTLEESTQEDSTQEDSAQDDSTQEESTQ